MSDWKLPGEGWRSWMRRSPDMDGYRYVRVEIIRDGDDKVETVIPSAIHPEWNVFGVYWRPIQTQNPPASDKEAG